MSPATAMLVPCVFCKVSTPRGSRFAAMSRYILQAVWLVATRLDLAISVASGAHGLLTTPGATRFYRSDGAPALQRANISLAADAPMEWLPLEAIAYNGCLAENRLTLNLAPGAELLGWDATALGLPLAAKPFLSGHFCQHLDMPGVWLERANIHALDQ